MDPRPLLLPSPPQETPSSSGSSAQYEPPPSHRASSSPRSPSQRASSSPRSGSPPNVPLPPPSPPPPSPRMSSPASASAQCELPPPSAPLQAKGTSEGNKEVQTEGATATINDELPEQDRTLSLPRSTAPPATSAPPLSPSTVAGGRPSTFWRFILPTRISTLPVTDPQPIRESSFRKFKQWHKSCQGHLLPDGVIQVRIAVCGFAFYGIMALLGNTWDLIKEFKEKYKVLVLFLIRFFWTIATVAVPLTMSARTILDKALSQHATRLVLLGITLHMLFNISLMLPQNVWVTSEMNLWSLVASVFLLVLAIIGHGFSWIQSAVYGEVEENPTVESENNMGS